MKHKIAISVDEETIIKIREGIRKGIFSMKPLFSSAFLGVLILHLRAPGFLLCGKEGAIQTPPSLPLQESFMQLSSSFIRWRCGPVFF